MLLAALSVSLLSGRCYKRRRTHSVDTANIKVLRVSFFDELRDEPVDTAWIGQTIDAVTGLRNNYVPAVRQVMCHLFAA
jgi:hypothetical protein